MNLGGWRAHRAGRPSEVPPWIADLEPWTTGLLAQQGVKVWSNPGGGAVGIRPSGVVYPVFPGPVSGMESGARTILRRVPESWCLMGPAAWVDVCEPWMPPSTVSHRVDYHFLVRGPEVPEVPPGVGDLRMGRIDDAERLFPLQEGYEKEEVLFNPDEFQPLASRLHFRQTLDQQVVVALWSGGEPVAKAGTNALTDRWAQLGGVYTRPDHRRRGLQRRLLAWLLAHLAAQGRGTCLFVKKSNDTATHLYRSLGFQPSGEFRIVYGRRWSWVPGVP